MEINVKAGLVTTIANSVYSSALMKIRESLSNSIDSGASVCLFFLKSKDKGYAISIVDNGAGITTDRFGEIFKSIGYGLERTQVNTYSYFGLGLMSIFKLGKEVHIISKSKDGEIKKVRIESSNFFAEENENRSIQELQGFVTYSKSSMEEREEISCLSDESLFKIIGTSPNSFTEIVISDVYPEDVQEITSTGFVDEIRKFAPLKVNPSDQFFDNLDACDKAEVVELLSNDVYFPTIDYYFGTEYEDQIISLTKYFPNFDLGGKKFQKYICKVIDNEFAIYAFYTTKILHSKTENKESGIWIRNKNFLVKASDYLAYQGFSRIIGPPLANWFFCDISHKNMKGFLEVTRNEFVTKSKSFKAFRAKVEAEIQPLNQRLRDIYDYGVHRVEEITGPFVSIGKGDDSDPFHKAQKKLHTLVEGNIAETRAQILGTLGQIRSLKLEETPTIIDKIKSFGETITLEENEKSFIYIDPKNKSSVAQITYDVHSDRSNVSIPPSIFDPKPITFIGDKYIVYFVDGNEIDSGISINTETGKIFVNIFSVSLKNYSISFIDMLLTVEYAHKISSGKDQMRENILLILGADYSKKSELEVYTCLETEID